MSLLYLLQNVNIDDREERAKNNLNVLAIESFLLFNSKIVFSEKHILFTNERGVSILSVDELINLLKFETKYTRYLGTDSPTVEQVISELLSTKAFSVSIIYKLYGSLPNITIVEDCQEESKMLNHYLKKANKVTLKDIFRDGDDGCNGVMCDKMRSLISTGLDMETIILKKSSMNKKVVYAFINVQEDSYGYIYPVINILNYQPYALKRQVSYTKYIIPVYILRRILDSKLPLVIEVGSEDMLWSSQLCPICKFSIASSVYPKILNLFVENRNEEDFDYEEV